MKTQTVNLNDLFSNQFQELTKEELSDVYGGSFTAAWCSLAPAFEQIAPLLGGYGSYMAYR